MLTNSSKPLTPIIPSLSNRHHTPIPLTIQPPALFPPSSRTCSSSCYRIRACPVMLNCLNSFKMLRQSFRCAPPKFSKFLFTEKTPNSNIKNLKFSYNTAFPPTLSNNTKKIQIFLLPSSSPFSSPPSQANPQTLMTHPISTQFHFRHGTPEIKTNLPIPPSSSSSSSPTQNISLLLLL